MTHHLAFAGAPSTDCGVSYLAARMHGAALSTDLGAVDCPGCRETATARAAAEAEARAAYEARRAARATAPADVNANYDLVAGQSARVVERTDREAPAGRPCPECGGSTCPRGECRA